MHLLFIKKKPVYGSIVRKLKGVTLDHTNILLVTDSTHCVTFCTPCALEESTFLLFLGKYVVLFFYPLDFTFVCPTEIIAFSDAVEEFRKINCEVIGASVDSHFCHLAWWAIKMKKKHVKLKGSYHTCTFAVARLRNSHFECEMSNNGDLTPVLLQYHYH